MSSITLSDEPSVGDGLLLQPGGIELSPDASADFLQTSPDPVRTIGSETAGGISPAGGWFPMYPHRQSELLGNALNGAHHTEGKRLVVSLDTGPRHGSLTLEEDGSFAYRPEKGFLGFDEFTCAVSTLDGRASQIATVVIPVLPEFDPGASPAVGALAPTGSRAAVFDAYSAAKTVDGGEILRACQWEVDPTSMFVPSLQGDFVGSFSWDFPIGCLPAVTGDAGEGTGVITVSCEVASAEDAQGNCYYSELVYCSYSFHSLGSRYFGERITRIDAFAVDGVVSYCYTSRALDTSSVPSAVAGTVDIAEARFSGRVDTVSIDSTIVAYQAAGSADAARALEIHNQVLETDSVGSSPRSETQDGQMLQGGEETSERLATFVITRFDYSFLPEQDEWICEGTRQESGSEILTADYQLTSTPSLPVEGPVVEASSPATGLTTAEDATWASWPEADKVVRETGQTTQVHQYTAFSVLRGGVWDSIRTGTRSTQATTEEAIRTAPYGIDSWGADTVSQTQTTETEAYHMVFLSGVLAGGAMTLSGETTSTKNSSHSGTYTISTFESSGGIQLERSGQGAWSESSQYSYQDSYEYTKTFDIGDPEDPEDDVWVLSSGYSQTQVLESTEFGDIASGTYVKTILNGPGPEDDEVIEGCWDEGVVELYWSHRTVESTVDASGQWVNGGTEEFSESGYRYVNTTTDDMEYSRSITGGTVSGIIGMYEGKFKLYDFAGTRTLTEIEGQSVWVLTAGTGKEIEAESSGRSYDGAGTYTISGSSGSGADYQSWSIDGSIVEFGRIGGGHAVITDYEPADRMWQVTDVTPVLYNTEWIYYSDTSSGQYTQGPMSGQITQRDGLYWYRWDAFVWEDPNQPGILAGTAIERALLRLDNASSASGQIEDFYAGFGDSGCGYGQVTFQREDSDQSSFRQETGISFTLVQETTGCGCGCGCGSGAAHFWRHESGWLDESASREMTTRRWTDTPQQASSGCEPGVTERTIEFDETDGWSTSRRERWAVVPEESTLDHEDYYLDRVEVWQLADGSGIERFWNDYSARETTSGTENITYDGQQMEGSSNRTLDRSFARTLTIEEEFDRVNSRWDYTYSGTGCESIDDSSTGCGTYTPEASCGCGCGCGCGGGSPAYDGTINYSRAEEFETSRNLVYSKPASHESVAPRTIYDGPTSLSSGCGCDGGIPSPGIWDSAGWAVSGSGAGTIQETWHVDHQRQRDWTGAPIGGTTLSGTETESSDDTWLYSLTFSEAKPQGTSSTAWQFTSVSGEGGGLFYADHTIEGSGNYQFDVRQGLATLQGVKNYSESLVETNNHSIGFIITANGQIAFDMAGHGNQTLTKDFDYDGQTGATSYAGGYGTITLDESGDVHLEQTRSVDWHYDGVDYDADAETTKTTSGSHVHNYQDDYSYSGCGYSYSEHASWSENSSWENQLTKRHAFSDSAWSTLWTDRFTSYEQSGCGGGGGSKATSYSSSGCGCGCGEGSSESDNYSWTGSWSESYDSATDDYSLSGGIDNHVTGAASGCGCGSSYDEWVDYIGFRWPTYTSPYAFDYVYPTQTGKLNGGLGEGCGCGCGGGLYGFETDVPIGRTSDTSANSTIGRLPTGGLTAPSPLAAAADLSPQLGPFRTLPEAPAAARAVGLTSYREPNAIHGNGSPELPQNAVFAEWGAWRDRGRLNQDLEDAIEELANLTTPPPGGPRPDKTEMPGVVVLDLYDTDQSGDQSVTVSVPSGAGSGHALRAPEGPDALVAASLEGGSLTISVPQDSTAAGLTAVTVVGKDAEGLPVAWTVLVHVVAVEGYTVEEQAWGETAWDAPEDSGEDWALLWQCNDYRWLPQTTFDGLVTAADWGFASMTVDSSRERWAYGTPGSTGVVAINPVVTFGGQNIYFETLNTAVVGLHETGPSTTQPRIAVTYLSLVEWEPVAWSREVEIEDYGTSVGLAKLTSGEDGHLVYPDYRQHPVIQQPIDHNVVRVKVQLGAPVPEGMLGTVHLAWYDPDNTVANVPAEPPANPGDGLRDNAASLAATGGGLPAFTLAFTTAGPSPTSDSIQKAYLAIEDARYGDNFIVAVHPHSGIAETFEFRENESQEPVLMRPANTGLWTPLPDDDDPGDDPADAVHDHRTSVLTIMPSVDIDTDSDNTGVIDRSDGEDYIEASPAYTGNVILINADDDNNNGAPDWADEPMNSPDDDLHPIVLEVCLPDASSMAGFELHLECTSNLSLWQDQSKNQLPLSASEVRLRHYKWTFESGMPNYPLTVYVEGLNMGRGQVSWALRDVSGNTVYSDSVVLTITGADLDADSDNNNSLERSLHEDQVEDAPGEPGKIIRAALRDDADHDRIPDFADGYDRDGVLGSNDDVNCGALASLVLDLFPQIDLGLARFKFAYGASDPASVTQSGDLYIAAPGNLRIWKKDASVQRNKLDAATGGDYVAPNVEYTASDLGLSSGNRVVQFYLEGINPGVTTVTLLTDMDGPSGPMGFIPMDTVKVMVVYVDLDVNNNGALFDAVDGVDYYLPGYEGTTDKLTFNKTFNTTSYGGQHMKLIAAGVGSGQGIDAVSFRITNTTSLPGYAENKTAYMVTGPVRNDDYSFALTANSRAALGTMAATNTFADFYCKDYGGSATVVASLIKNGVAVFTWTLDVPTDTDQDGLADRWERQQIAEWNTQYGYSHDVYDLTFVRRDYDWEMPDPDASNTDGGTDLPAHKTTGDSLTEFQEYRGFILDGGNSHAGGHRRLSTSRKELLVEVDIMEGVEHMPTEAGIRSTMNTVSAGFGDLTEGAGIDLYYVIDEPTASHRDFSSYAQAESWANAHRHRTNGQPNMLTEFVYLAFADSMAGSTGGFAGSYGAFVVVDSAHDFATNQGFNVTSHRAYVAAHELTHMIIDTHNANGFNGGEHLPDPNENGVQDDADDGRYLMYHHQTAQNTSGIHFSNPTRRQIDLTSKESVER